MSDISTNTIPADPRTADRARDTRAIKEKAVAAKDAVADLASEAKRYASHRAQEAKETTSHWVDTAKTKAAGCQESLVDYVQRNPYKAIGIAAGVGFVVGLILKRR